MNKRIPSLDGLRAVSILLVLLGHVYFTRGYTQNVWTERLSRFSHFGVEIFFVISGFLITSLLLKEESKVGGIDLPAFYRRRSFRILPAALTYTVFVVSFWAVTAHHIPMRYIVAAFTYTLCYFQSLPWAVGHLWSLSVEEQFYLLWPLAIVWFPKTKKSVCWAVMVLSPLARVLYLHYNRHLVFYAFPAVADAIAAGCLLALYKPRLPAWAYKLPSAMVVSLTALATVKLEESSSCLLWGLIPLSIALALHILVERADWVLNNRAIVYAGVMSYPLYLCQQPFMNRFSTEWWTAFPQNIGFTIVAAMVMHAVVELPMLSAGRRVERRLRAEAEVASDVSIPA